MKLDFEKYNGHVTYWSTTDYKIKKGSNNYFLYLEGYQKFKLPVQHYESMDWITFNSMDINNDKIPELFIFTESYNDRDDIEYGQTAVYEIKK